MKTKLNSTNGQQNKSPVGYFILLPSDGGTMLLKSIASNELLLPADCHQSVDEPSNETTEAISASLDMVRIMIV